MIVSIILLFHPPTSLPKWHLSTFHMISMPYIAWQSKLIVIHIIIKITPHLWICANASAQPKALPLILLSTVIISTTFEPILLFVAPMFSKNHSGRKSIKDFCANFSLYLSYHYLGGLFSLKFASLRITRKLTSLRVTIKLDETVNELWLKTVFAR